MNAFEKFEIGHLSASSLNKANEDLGAWVVSYLYKYREPSNASMARGLAVEHGLESWMSEGGDPDEECLEEFERLTSHIPAEDKQRELDNLAGYVEQGKLAIEPYGLPSGYQERVEITVEGLSVPIIGYTDFTFDEAGRVPDLKTTGRMPSVISPGHCRQFAIYQKAKSNHIIEGMYVTPKKHAILTLSHEQYVKAMTEVTHISLRLQALLERFDSKEDLAAHVIPNFSSYYWNGPDMRAKGKEIFGY